MTELTLNELLTEMGRLFDDENTALYTARNLNENLQLLILQTRGLVRLYKAEEFRGLPTRFSAELTDTGLKRARELRGGTE